ncbi:MAG TPA: ribose 5-phosphate isomerase B [Candidatus Binatia bacterium]|nr:ribose 5-phosphate isomerase B [Candidatus Binatia bacterium]
MTAIALGADHAGFVLKEDLKVWLLARGHAVLDYGTHTPDAVDYPDYAALVAEAVGAGGAARGVLVCGTGIGMAMAANKVPGVRAAMCLDVEMARLSREHNDANVLALGARLTERGRALEILEAWLATPFAGGRHARRVAKVMALAHAHAAAR